MMKQLKTLRVRFALWVAGLLVAALVVFGGFVYLRVERGLNAAVDDALALSAAQAITAVNLEDGQLNLADSIPESGRIADQLGERGLTIRALDGTGHLVQALGHYHTLPVTPENLSVIRTRQSVFATLIDPTEKTPVRTYTAPIIENSHLVGLIQVIHNLGSVRRTLQRLLEALLIGTPLITIVGSFGSYFLVAQALKPIDHITRTARRIVSGKDLSAGARLHLAAPDDEVGRLGATLDEMLGRLNESFQRERQFTADASHELRTPLTAMQAVLTVIREERRTPEDYEQALDDIAEEADRLRSLVEDLLSLARSDSQPLVQREVVNLAVLLQDVTDALRPLAEAKRLLLSCNTPPDLPILGDSDALLRLFMNLLGNAIKYTEQGEVAVRGHRKPREIGIEITDTGIGIPHEHLPSLFQRFYRVDRARTAHSAGLGLAIALEIAHAHGGDIEVASTVGKGTTFTVRLPTDRNDSIVDGFNRDYLSSTALA